MSRDESGSVVWRRQDITGTGIYGAIGRHDDLSASTRQLISNKWRIRIT